MGFTIHVRWRSRISGASRAGRSATRWLPPREPPKAGEAARLKTLEAQLVEMQKRSHLQVFSTAPADEAMAALNERLPALLRELGVERLVSQWDEAALRAIPPANQLDVTDRLVREFNPDAKRRKTIETMKTTPPLPLERANQLMREGRL